MRRALALLLALALSGAGSALAQEGEPADGVADLLRRSEAGIELPTPSETGAPAVEEAAVPADPAARKADLAYGAFQRGFYLTALRIAEPLANLGDSAAQTLLGELYSRGLGVAQNVSRAAHWYKAAAAAGSPEAQFRYAMMLLDGTGGAPDPAQARDLMKSAADAGLPLAAYNYGQMIIQASPGGGFEEARAYFERAARAGIADAQYAMAQLHLYGRGAPQDLSAAREWLKAAASRGFETAQVEYGIWLINGKGGEARPRDGFLFLRRAAELGNPIAINRLAHLYKDGIGTPPDLAQAAKWAVLAKRVKNTDPKLDDFFRGLRPDAQKAALEAANRFRSG